MKFENEIEALAQGDKELSSGNLQEAERIYRAILLGLPDSKYAQYKLALILSRTSRTADSLIHFQTATILDPKNLTFKFDYIEALIKEDRSDEAVQILKTVREIVGDDKGSESSLLPRILSQSQLTQGLEKFYQKSINNILSTALQGWVVASNFDYSFLEGKPLENGVSLERAILDKVKPTIEIDDGEWSSDDASSILGDLNKEFDIKKKFAKLNSLTREDHPSITSDSFGPDFDGSLADALEMSMDDENLKILIIGGGVTGLFLACTLKNTLKNNVSILILENRSRSKNTRESFERNWLTHIPSNSIQELIPDNIHELMSFFGKDGYVGLPLRAIETLLTLSCKDQGTNFYFSSEIDISDLSLTNLDLVFDATGGRINSLKYSPSKSDQISFNVTLPPMDHSGSGIMPVRDVGFSSANPLKITLNPNGGFYYPHFGDTNLSYYMVKLTGIPARLMPQVRSFAKKVNVDNLFYIWEGHLKDPLNEGLIFINLNAWQASELTSVVQKKYNLKKFVNAKSSYLSFLDSRVLQLFSILVELDIEGLTNIERPFIYDPYIHMLEEIDTIGDKKIFPIGDSIYCGHPKQGNGLGFHLKFINELVREIDKLI